MSGIVISDGRLYTMGNEENVDTVHCLDAITGESLWQYSYPCATDPNEFDGLKNRLTGSQVIDMGATDGGDALTLPKLDELMDAVTGGPDLILCNKTMRRKVNSLVRAAGQAIERLA